MWFSTIVFMIRPRITPMTMMTDTWHANTVMVCSGSQDSWNQIVIWKKNRFPQLFTLNKNWRPVWTIHDDWRHMQRQRKNLAVEALLSDEDTASRQERRTQLAVSQMMIVWAREASLSWESRFQKNNVSSINPRTLTKLALCFGNKMNFGLEAEQTLKLGWIFVLGNVYSQITSTNDPTRKVM